VVPVDGQRRWKVGELAATTGVTVRTLHHFDEIGLLRPGARTAAGHRLYAEPEVRRLYRILALRHLGVPLSEIARSLDDPARDLGALVAGQLAQVDRELAAVRHLRTRLAHLAGVLGAPGGAAEPSIDDVIEALEATVRAGHFSDEQRARFTAMHTQPGFAQAFLEAMSECEAVAGGLAAHLAAGTGPADPAVQTLAGRWQAAFRRMSGGDPEALAAMYTKIELKGPETATRGILRADVWEYLRRAFTVGYPATGNAPGTVDG
jgi:MerR family transcriptional regulator, thiopeptide resistance regulator